MTRLDGVDVVILKWAVEEQIIMMEEMFERGERDKRIMGLYADCIYLITKLSIIDKEYKRDLYEGKI